MDWENGRYLFGHARASAYLLRKCEKYTSFAFVFKNYLFLQQFFTTITYQERLREMDL